MSLQPPAGGSRSRVHQLILRVGVATLCRLFLNTARRFPYPFAPALARGLGRHLTDITSIIALSQATALLSPLFGPVGDRWGYRVLMLGGLGCLAWGMLAAGLWPTYWAISAGIILAGLGKSVFDPAVQAYVGQEVSYRRRGLAIGLAELAWAGSTLVGVPVMGVLISQHGWRAPFLALAALAVLGGLMLAATLPRSQYTSQGAGRVDRTIEAWKRLLHRRVAVGGLIFGFLISVANDNLFVVYGAWLEGSFGLGVVALGAATTVIGVAEIGGEALTALLSDRIGLERAAGWGLVLSGLSYALLPFTDAALATCLCGLFFVFLFYEFTVVTSFSLLTEVMPEARATMMSAYVAALGLGRMLGALIGGPIWLAGGIAATGLVSAGVNGLALAFLVWGTGGWWSTRK